jgi:GT2 family glycosyltransferase
MPEGIAVNSTLAVSVVIPTYNGRLLLEKHLPAVLACLRPGDELIIADDTSSDDTIEWLSQWWQLQLEPTELTVVETKVWRGCLKITGWQHDQSGSIDIVLMVNQSNQRFGATCNRAVNLARHGLIFLLNNDVEPAADILNHLVPWFVDSDMFAVGCFEDEAGTEGGKNVLWFERGRFQHRRADELVTGPTAWASGGSALFSRAKWLDLAGFEKAYYPAYWEDIDLSFRAKQRGWRVWFDQDAKVKHLHESTNQDVFGQLAMRRMSWQHGNYFTWQHSNWWQKLQVIAWWPYWQWQWWRFNRVGKV